MQSVGATLDHADLVVQALDEPEGDLVVGITVGGNSIPMPVEQLGELLVGLQSLLLDLSALVLEELTSPGFAGVIPHLCERLLGQVDSVHTFVGPEQQLEVLSSVAGEILGSDSSAQFCPLMNFRLRPLSRAYSCLRTLSSASLRCRRT